MTHFADLIRQRLRYSLRSRGFPKRARTWTLLGYTARDLQVRLLPFLGKPCQDCGSTVLSLDNVHLDHIRPLATATTETEVLTLNTLDNLRLICGPCNLHKRAKLEVARAEI